LFKFYSRSKTTTITNFILDEIKRSISISVYYGWKRSTKNGRWRETDLNIIFWLQISYSPHSGWKYIKSNKKCVFNVNFQYNHKQVPTAYFSMMFNIHKHISHLIFVLVPECGEYEICNQKIMLRSVSRQRPFFVDRFHP
jgi:Zn-finger domain-containing protein